MKKMNKIMTVLTVVLGVGLAGTLSSNATAATKDVNPNQISVKASHINRPTNLEFVNMPMH